MPYIKLTTLLLFNVQFPSLAEQKRIASILGAAQAEIDLLKQGKLSYTNQKQGLMQQLLTGKTRLTLSSPFFVSNLI